MEELLVANQTEQGVSSYNILIDDVELDNTYEILGIFITKEINKISRAVISLRDGDVAKKDFEINSNDVLIPGKKIMIKLGYDGDNSQEFKGVITKNTVKVKNSGKTELVIECRDLTYNMTLGRKCKYYENLKDSALFDELVGSYSGLSCETETTGLVHKELVQHNITDWDFMLLRAEANGLLVNTDDGKIIIKKPDTNSEPVVLISYGTSILEFEAEMDSGSQWKSVEAVSWDYTNQSLFKADTSEAQGFKQQGNLSSSALAETNLLESLKMYHSGHLLEQELQDWVDGIMMRSRLAKIRGRLRVTGYGQIKPGDMFRLDGIGNRFNGNVFITAVKQEIAGGAWYTHIQFGLDPERFAEKYKNVNETLSGGLISAVHGLQIGKVVQLASDPDGEDRILVKIPVIDNNARGTWVRVASLDAGSDRGAFFMPEIDDEVIVGFINDDPRHAIMLGMVHSSAKKAPLTAQDANDEKGIFTRSKMRIHFNDQSKTITIDTPAGNSIQLDEQSTKIEIVDQNSNKITMDTSGIKVESPMNIEIKAGVNLTLTAGASLSIGGVSIKAEADASLEMKSAMSKLSASGITEISGSLVKIN